MVYRRVHMVWVFVITPGASSTLAALQVLENVTRVCVAAARSPDVTPEKLTKKFPEVGTADFSKYEYHCMLTVVTVMM